MRSEDGSEVIVDPNEMGPLARRRYAQAKAKVDGRRGDDIWRDGHFRGECPWCEAPIVAMSEIDPKQPRTVAPDVGDAIACGYCRRVSVVIKVDDNREMRLHPIELPSHG